MDDCVSPKPYHIYNKPGPDVVDNQAAHEFIKDLQEGLDNGFGFVPFIGAGLSAPSGIPLIWEIETYLQRCIVQSLGRLAPTLPSWNPRTDQWPPFVADGQYKEPDFSNLIRDALQRRREADRLDPSIRVFQEALGALAEWRTALLFLSRLTRENREDPDVFALDAPRQEVIDAGIREIMRGKRPTLGHRMLAVLGSLLRLDIVLTTNFDDLLEQAFQSAGNPLTVFGLHLTSDLPPYSALAPQRSIVKLHGDRHSLRADYTLDAAPSELDWKHFIEYLVTAAGRNALSSKGADIALPADLPVANHLLVMGFTAHEQRTRTFIEHAWRCLSGDFSVFWLCHTTRDVNNVQTFTTEAFDRLRKNKKINVDTNPKRSRILRHPHLGLLFLHIYQSLQRKLPLTGLVFPAVSQLAIPPIYAKTGPRESLQVEFVDDLVARVKAFDNTEYSSSTSEHRRNLIVVTSANRVNGVTSIGVELFERLQDDRCCIWLDMNDIFSTDDLFEQLLDATNYRIGSENWLPIFVPLSLDERANAIRRLVKSTTRSWVFFLNARETPGSNKEPVEKCDEKANGWLDAQTPPDGGEDRSACTMEFLRFLSVLCQPGHGVPSISVVLLTRDAQSHVNIELQHRGFASHIATCDEDSATKDDKSDNIVRDCVAWMLSPNSKGTPLERGSAANEEPLLRDESVQEIIHRKASLLLALVLTERTRFSYSVWSDVFVEKKPDERKLSLKWIGELEANKLLYRERGDLIRLHAVARTSLREILRSQQTLGKYLTDRSDYLKHVGQESLTLLKAWQPETYIPLHYERAQSYRRVVAEDPAVRDDDSIVRACIAWICSKETDGEITERRSAGKAKPSWPGNSVDKIIARKGRFLLAIILMQRTRFLASVWSDAFVKEVEGTESYNPNGEEVEETESYDPNVLLKWIDELENCGLVRRKHGGLIWLRAISRKNLRDILRFQETLDEYLRDNHAFFANVSPESLELLSRSWKPQELIPEIHWRLAQWYRRVISAANTPIAVFEAVYHACESAATLLRKKEELNRTEAAQLVERIRWASTLLQSHAFMIQTRGYSHGSCRRLRAIRDEQVIEIGEQLCNIRIPQGFAEVAKYALRGLAVRCSEIMRALAREVGEIVKMYRRHGEVAALLTEKAVEESWETSDDIVKEWLLCGHSTDSEAAKVFGDSIRGEVLGDPCVEWLRYWRWTGLLRIASRSYDKAQRAFLTGLTYAANAFAPNESEIDALSVDTETAACDGKMMQLANRLIRKFLDNHRIRQHQNGDIRIHKPQQVCLEVLRLTEQVVDCSILCWSVKQRSSTNATRGNSSTDETTATTDIKGLVARGMELADVILAEDEAGSSSYTAAVMWCKSRLLLHAGICESLLADRQSQAMALLTDAEACLGSVDARRHDTDRVRVELCRANVKLQEAERCSVTLLDGVSEKKREIPFVRLPNEFIVEDNDADLWTSRGPRKRKEVFGEDSDDKSKKKTGSDLQKVKSLVCDAMRFLDRAEIALLNRRRNVSWTTWYFHRRLQAIAMTLWASVVDQGTPIPFVGLSAAPPNTCTIADELLENASRMITYDAYRMATIVDAYASCTKALYFRLFLDTDAQRLIDRQKSMREKLGTALAHIDEIQENRRRRAVENMLKGLGKEEMEGKVREDTEVSRYVQRYITSVKSRVGKTIEQLRPLQ